MRHLERGETEERLRQRLKLESQLAEQKMKVALLEKQSEFDKREATLEKELLTKDLVTRSLVSQSQQNSPKSVERKGLTPLIDIEDTESPPSDYSLPCFQNRPRPLTCRLDPTLLVVEEGMNDPGRCPTLAASDGQLPSGVAHRMQASGFAVASAHVDVNKVYGQLAITCFHISRKCGQRPGSFIPSSTTNRVGSSLRVRGRGLF